MDIDQYFRELVALSSPSLKEELVSSYIKEKMNSFGYEIREDSVGNLLCIRGKSRERMLLSGHMDTVAPALNAVMLEDDKHYYTDGTTALGADDKCALAVLLEKAEHYSKDNIAFFFTVAEEIGLYGSRHLGKSLFCGIDISSAYVLDAEKEIGSIINEASGKSRIKVQIEGRSAHAGFNPETGISAIAIAARIITKLPQGRVDDITTLNVGSFISEGSTNVVPDKAEFIFEIRSLDDDNRYRLIDKIQKEAEMTAEENGGKAIFEIEELYSHFIVNEGSATVTKAATAMEMAGIEPKLCSTMGGSDANNLNRIGIETVVLSSGYFNAHSKSEYLDKAEFRALKRFTDAISEI